ncbi:hypothetical protein VH570_10760 [Sphingobium sp. HT1-2]|uniref:hypothetical protein n=1 Tax=Sphingobium sp. HT1-2 TaxID=3111640 RepID=UPI003C0DB8DB
MAAVIIPFPRQIHQGPHDPEAWKSKPDHLWTLEDSAEEARFRCAELRLAIAELDDSDDQEDCIRRRTKAAALHLWTGLLIEREAKARGAVLEHNGVTYSSTAGRA